VTILSALLVLFLNPAAAQNPQIADEVLVVKSESRLYLLKGGEELASFRVAFGGNPKGHKQQGGDGRTPEGRYVLDYKNAGSAYYKSIHVSYPNIKDRESAKKRDVSPGGDIMIHGQKNRWGWLSPIAQRFNWTDGCIALTNKEMDVVWKAVKVGTPIEIKP
jgi:murein L,D-transpeptidase YafK